MSFFKPSPRGKVRYATVFIVLLVLVVGTYDQPKYYNRAVQAINNILHTSIPTITGKNFKLGLDLQGGVQLIYQGDLSKVQAVDSSDSMQGVRDVVERRVNSLGVAESVVQVAGSDKLVVELPGVVNVEDAIKSIGETPLLEFKEQNTAGPEPLTKEQQKDLVDFNAKALKKANEALAKLKTGGVAFEALVKEYSDDDQAIKDTGGDLGYLSKSKDPDLVGEAERIGIGRISRTLYKSESGYEIIRVDDIRNTEKQVRASHLLVCYTGAARCQASISKEDALKKINDLKAKATAANFAQLVKDNSTEPGADQTGGDLGYFEKGRMVKPFEDTVFPQKTGTIIGPVETEFGYHLIHKADEKPVSEYKLRRILVKTKKDADIQKTPEPFKNTGLTGAQLAHAQVQFNNQTGDVLVALEFNDDGRKLFKEITTRNLQKPVAIYLDGTPISVPTVQSVITDGRAVITGRFTLQEAKQLAQRLNAGALPVPISLISQQKIEASLGNVSLEQSLFAAMVGFLAVGLFMILYYRLPGVVAVLALAIYVIIDLALLKLFGVTLTLAGIAGFIVSMGMAVDANVLIFERMKEEIALGKPLGTAIEEGFKRAWPSIRDSNITTLAGAIVLFWFGTSLIKGFGLTLSIGVIVSMFTALRVSKILLELIAPWPVSRVNFFYLGKK